MAETPKKASGKGVSKKLGPLPYWGWGAVGVGTFLAYRFLKARSAAGAVNAASGTTGGTTIPNDIGLPGAAATAAGNFASTAAWTQAALAFMVSAGLDPATALNAVTSWLNGNCVTQAGYNAISGAIASNSVGLPPGYSNVPTLSVCTGQTGSTSGPYSTESQYGSGFYNTGVAAETAIADAAGNLFTWLPNQQSVQSAQANGETVFYQPVPGKFVKVTNWASLAPGTPVFLQTGGTPAASTTG